MLAIEELPINELLTVLQAERELETVPQPDADKDIVPLADLVPQEDAEELVEKVGERVPERD